LINSKPEVYSNWNIEYCIERYFEKILNQLSNYANFSLKAQTLLYSEFDSHPVAVTRSSSADEVFFYLKPSDLSIMTNHIGTRLGSRISDSSALEFIVYVPTKSPMYIISDPKNPTTSSRISSFLVPRYGGVHIYNHETSDEDQLIKVNEAMKTFLTQFIDLIGIKLNQNPGIVRSNIYQTELFNYLLANTLRNLLNSINTLKSLSSLLTKISSMVIEDKIAAQVEISVNSIEYCIRLLSEGNIEKAFFESRNAFSTSEKAFFDQSLLEKLYFPEDQRFAIYIPLFIPVGIPIVLSLKSVIAYVKQQRQQP